MKNANDRIEEIYRTISDVGGATARQVAQRLVEQKTLAERKALSEAISLAGFDGAAAGGKPRRDALRALLLVTAVYRNMGLPELREHKRDYLAKLTTRDACVAKLTGILNKDPVWKRQELGLFEFRVGYFDQNNVIKKQFKDSENAQGICSGFALIWILEHMDDPGRTARERLQAVKAQHDKAYTIQDIRANYDKKLRPEANERFQKARKELGIDTSDEMTAYTEAEKRLQGIGTKLNSREMKRNKSSEEYKKLAREYDASEKLLEAAKKNLAPLNSRLKAIESKIGDDWTARGIAATIADYGLSAELYSERETDYNEAFKNSIDVLNDGKRGSYFLASIQFGNSNAYHMWSGFLGLDYFVLFDPNRGEYRIEQRSPEILFREICEHYRSDMKSAINSMMLVMGITHEVGSGQGKKTTKLEI